MKTYARASKSVFPISRHKLEIVLILLVLLLCIVLFGYDLAPSTRQTCACDDSGRKLNTLVNSSESWCSPRASARGVGQNVISYSLFTSEFKDHSYQKAKRDLYKNNFHCSIDSMRKIYPGWVMRIYTDYEPHELCGLGCEDDVDVCDVRTLPHFGNIKNVNPMVWRFLVLGDPTVRMFMVRDSDNDLSPREQFAVEDWILSKMPYHGMRDHPYHGTPILGCAWGGNNELIGYSTGYNISLSMLHEARKEKVFRYGADQEILTKTIYSKYKDLFLTHDSYTCTGFPGSTPFPVRREQSTGGGMEFVGMPKKCRLEDGFYKFAYGNELDIAEPLPECPMECRPTYGTDWNYC